jgi:hypothetical protein
MTQAFNLSQFANKVNSSGLADLTTAVTGTLPVANGGTNQTTYTNGQLLIGNTTGNTLTKSTLTAGSGVTITNGSGAITIAAASGQIQTEIFTGPGTWTCPASTTQVRVTVIGGGGGGTSSSIQGGLGGLAVALVPVSAPVTITVGAGGAGGIPTATSGGTSSFGPAVSSTGGGVGNPAPHGAGTVSLGTALKTGNVGFGQTGTTLIVTYGVISGLLARFIVGGSAPGTPYTTSSSFIAGARGSPTSPTTTGGIGGAVVVEWVS